MSDIQTVSNAAKTLRSATSKTNKARVELRDALRAANADGASLRQLAAATGLSFARIHQIIKGY